MRFPNLVVNLELTGSLSRSSSKIKNSEQATSLYTASHQTVRFCLNLNAHRPFPFQSAQGSALLHRTAVANLLLGSSDRSARCGDIRLLAMTQWTAEPFAYRACSYRWPGASPANPASR